MATIMYDGKQIAGGGVSIVHMTEQQYLQNKTALDASDLLIEITDKDYPVEAGNIGFTPPTGMSATNVQGAIEEENTKVNNTIARFQSKTNPIVMDLAPYSNFEPVTGGGYATSIDFAVQDNTLFIRCFDSNESQIAWYRVSLTPVT